MAPWVWWVLAVLVVAGAIGIPLLIRSRRRHQWQEEFAAAEQETAWFARTLVPELRDSRTAEAIRGAWSVSEPRVVENEDRLTALAASTGNSARGDRAVALRDGVRNARIRIDGVTLSGVSDATAELDAVVAELEAVLPPRPEPDA